MFAQSMISSLTSYEDSNFLNLFFSYKNVLEFESQKNFDKTRTIKLVVAQRIKLNDLLATFEKYELVNFCDS